MAPERTGHSKPRRKPRESMGVRKMSRYLEDVKEVSPNDYELIQKFVTDYGKIIPARLTGATAKQQRQIRNAVKRARVMGILP